MPAGHPYRSLLLPGLTVLLPSIFIVVLGSWWLTLEHETARLRSSEAAASSLTHLRGDLLRAIASEGARLTPGTETSTAGRPSALIKAAAFFDATGRFVGPGTAPDGSPAIAETSRRAAQLLAQGAAAIENGSLPEARRAATSLIACCADARDEFGVSYALYASWQLVVVSRRQPGEPREFIVRSLRDAVDRGLLNRPADVAGVRQLADQLSGMAGAASLVTEADERATRAERRRQFVDTARDWMAAIGAARTPTEARVSVAPWPGSDTSQIGAVWTAQTALRGVMLIDPEALADWVGRWSDVGAPFGFVVRTPHAEAQIPDSSLVAPLFADAPAVEVVALRPSADPAADRLRERLFMAAAAAALALTLLSGGLAARDVVRERRLAAVRATFLAGVTHEIKTPITSIRLMAETLQHGRAGPDASGELLGTIVNEAEHLSDLVDNLLSTSRIESGARTYRPRVVAFGEAVRSARRRFDYTLTKEGFTLTERFPDAPIWVRVDPEALEQAVLNLLSNAMKYSGASREIGITVEADSESAMVRVADRGVGVPAAEHARIFRSFYRTSTAERVTTGTGLGLALVRHFADSHDGDVSVRSEPGHGSVFTITLPRVPAPDAGADSVAAGEPVAHDVPSPTHG